jgi:hypothetical protein
MYFVEKGNVNKWCVVWAYSFWARRHHENPANIPHLVSALKYLRDELYAPNAQPPVMDKDVPPIEPYLTSDMRPNELLYPWKLYTDRVKFVEHGGDEYDYLIVEKNGKEHLFLSWFEDDDMVLSHGDVIDLTWEMEILYDFDGDTEVMKFCEWAHSVRMVTANPNMQATKQFAKKYGGIPRIDYEYEDTIDEEMKLKLINRFLGYLLESKNPTIRETLEKCGKRAEKLMIIVSSCEERDDPRWGKIYGYGFCLSLAREDDDQNEYFYGVMCFVYNPDTGELYIDAEVALG